MEVSTNACKLGEKSQTNFCWEKLDLHNTYDWK